MARDLPAHGLNAKLPESFHVRPLNPANFATEQVISGLQTTVSAGTAFVPDEINVDVDRDGTNDYTEKTYEISRHFKDKGMMRKKIVPLDFSKPMPQPMNLK